MKKKLQLIDWTIKALEHLRDGWVTFLENPKTQTEYTEDQIYNAEHNIATIQKCIEQQKVISNHIVYFTSEKNVLLIEIGARDLPSELFLTRDGKPIKEYKVIVEKDSE